MTTRMVAVDGAELCVETFGDPGDPTVLLINGGGQSMDWWETDFCRLLADAGRHVVRYDHRDVGRSTGSPRGEPTYTGDGPDHGPAADPRRARTSPARTWPGCRWAAASRSPSRSTTETGSPR